MAKSITAPVAPVPEPAVVTLSWAADSPAPTLDELAGGQIAADQCLGNIVGDLEDLDSLCRTLASNLDTTACRLQDALRVIAERLKDIGRDLYEQRDAIVPLYNLAASYHRAVKAQGVTR